MLVDGTQISTLRHQGSSNTLYNVNRKAREVKLIGAPIGRLNSPHLLFSNLSFLVETSTFKIMKLRLIFFGPGV